MKQSLAHRIPEPVVLGAGQPSPFCKTALLDGPYQAKVGNSGDIIKDYGRNRDASRPPAYQARIRACSRETVTQYEALPAQRPVLFRSWPIPPRGTLTSAIRSLKSLPPRNCQPVTRNSELIRLARSTRAVVDSISVPGRVSRFDRAENKGIVYIPQWNSSSTRARA